ncbi:uncharacterized protein LOC119766213 [Culex quinquefasciatus]|uniref:uncharacterized protein LOC119766213 n=1 Tax=Culex quinquefasciatus TaxID=7176 RepID=UPI0018E397D4|nr:uncharacterized protein LOC119766213 [Culex quinquefasciatus]
MGDLQTLRKKQEFLLNKLEVLNQFVEHYKAEEHECQLEVRLGMLNDVYQEFTDLRTKLELLLEEKDAAKYADAEPKVKQEVVSHREEANLQVVQEFDNKFCKIKAMLIAKRPVKDVAQTIPSVGDADTSFPLRVKLPDIHLPNFSGNLREWVTFRDTFKSLIHRNSKLTSMDKFTYLQSSLSGPALLEISGIDLSEENYSVAWSALEEEYGNKKLIVKAHLDVILDLEPLTKESYDGLSHLLGEFEKNLQMLDKMGENTANWSTVMAHVLCSKLDSATLRNWETHHNSKEVPTYKALLEYLRGHCSVLQSIKRAKAKSSEQRPPKTAVCHTAVRSSNQCQFCSGPWHTPFRCFKFQKMTISERNDAVTRNKLCRNCLKPGHYPRTCEGGTCHHCHQKHHSMLHNDQMRSSVPQQQSRPTATTSVQRQQPRPQNTNQTTHTPANNAPANPTNLQTTDSQTTQPQTTSQNYVALPVTPTHNIILSTALIRIKDRFGNTLLARALLDSCSQHCLMTREFSRRLKFVRQSSYLPIQGIGTSCCVSTQLVRADVGPRSDQISAYESEMQFHVLPKLNISLPTSYIDPSTIQLPDWMFLADPEFHKTGPVDVIIGAEFYMDLLTDERVKPAADGPTLHNTVFGWIISGRLPGNVPESTSLVSVAAIDELLTRFWELETCRTKSTHSIEESTCEQLFEETTVRDETGRFVVTLPKKKYAVQRLGESRSTAIKRFLGLEKRLSANPDLKQQYSDFIHEYEAMGHMKRVAGDTAGGELAYYLPHHCVLRPDSTTTKLRVVFDASCRTSTGVALNDAPVVQDDLLDIALRFRLHAVAIVADIAKMYRMIRVQPDDQTLQRIVWRDNVDEPIRIYELTTVTYGTASAPYLATKCLQKLGEIGEKTHPSAAKVLKRDFYVDDMLAGAHTFAEGKELVAEMVDLMESGGFSLRKWHSNSRDILLDVPEHLRDERTLLELDTSDATVKTLGLVWEPSTDCFRFRSPKWNDVAVITKRVVASDMAMIFDPYGLIGPVVVQTKIFVQKLWRMELDWDAALPEDLQEYWREYRRNLAGLDSMSIPRWIGTGADDQNVQLHGFCDASVNAYGACIYIRTVSANGDVTVRLLASKSRIAPLENLKKKKRKQSIPRLELASALLLAHLYEKVANAINFRGKAFFWTDSMIVRCWLASLPSRWNQFVANRVSEIQHLTESGSWDHVPGIENPADIISRGMTPMQLQYSKLWFSGPDWLSLDHQHWPHAQVPNAADFDHEELEEHNAVAVVAHDAEPCRLFTANSSYTVTIRTTAVICRFCFNSRAANKHCRRVGPLTAEELEVALKKLVRLAQRECFPEEYDALSRDRAIPNNSRIAALNPRIVDGILCVGGRLQHAAVSDNRKHPYILDHRHPFTKLIVTHYHETMFHAGQQLLISAVRERFWPINIRNLVREVIHKCVDCFRVKPKVLDQLMADLPPERVTPCTPFARVGVDYCGPFQVAYPQRRARPVKCFVAIFVCLVTKAVHLELAADLTTQAFLAALKRFTARRGKPKLVMCDNAKNFVGARRELSELAKLFLSQQFEEEIIRETANDSIEFKFIPARSPNFGGLWESAVKSFKLLFKRTIGLHTLLYDEFQTVLVQIEAILNSRPLTPLSNDPADFEALIPGHFLIQRPLTAIPEPNLDHIPENRLSAWQTVQRYTQQLWKKWSNLYLSDLHNRTKWTKQKDNVAVGTMVLLKDENLPPLKWQLGRVSDIHPGIDGNIRVVTVRTKDGSYQRAISKICILPIRDNLSTAQGEN